MGSKRKPPDDPRLDWEMLVGGDEYEADFLGGKVNVSLLPSRRWDARLRCLDSEYVDLGQSDRGIGAYTAMAFAEDAALAWAREEMERLDPPRRARRAKR